ncbi:DNA repair protein RadC [Myxococcus sp. CA051A]|uniref:RadC family protein n=1 Tax=unclassified Myxococcus TaxID=2648731 RepID=UPI00157AE384|nr:MULTISPECIES: DNA repair protein RadC [unclassified Myxococcus]NTX17510.1 DNA repair protein RadC [Myxococcus sp. CA056]NTX39090.1 DNA repair protein RadC [Myxococcus sp. CA033]NTX66496.1 DNA repair protein RadC [Myxococcus sp. CA051A]
MEWSMGGAWTGSGEVVGEESVGALAPGGMEQSRERLFRLGAQALTDSELLCVTWGLAPRSRGGLEAAGALLKRCGGLKALLQAEPVELRGVPGLGPRRAAQVLAALELGRRAQRSPERRPKLRTPREIHAYLTPALGALRREVFHVLCFNARNVLVHDARVAEGTLNTCPVDPREVFAAALVSRATAIVLAHNHPSGDPEPSVQDVGLTRHLVAGAKLLNLKVLDHLVVGDGAFVSMLERGLLPDGEWESKREWNVAGGDG